jgi:glycosyltransferase involved in cell wall biosynthesis
MLDPWFHRTNRLKEAKKWLYWPWGDYRVLRDAHAVLFTAEREMRLARQSFWLYKLRREVVVGLGITTPPGNPDAQRQLFLTEWPELHGKRLWLYLSRIHPKKGVDLLIEAFAAVAGEDPLLHMVIAGPDQIGWQAQLQLRASVLGLADRITWTGMLSGDLKWGAFLAAELFCLPSHQENFGMVVAEALACGVPVLISDQVNISDEVAEAGAGIVHADTQRGTVDALRNWIALKATERRMMARNALDLFHQKFEIGQAASALIRVLKAHESRNWI